MKVNDATPVLHKVDVNLRESHVHLEVSLALFLQTSSVPKVVSQKLRIP